MDRCHWVTDRDVPGGKFLVPGCYNRAVYGDDAECHCVTGPETSRERLERKLDDILARLDRLEGKS